MSRKIGWVDSSRCQGGLEGLEKENEKMREGDNCLLNCCLCVDLLWTVFYRVIYNLDVVGVC